MIFVKSDAKKQRTEFAAEVLKGVLHANHSCAGLVIRIIDLQLLCIFGAILVLAPKKSKNDQTRMSYYLYN